MKKIGFIAALFMLAVSLSATAVAQNAVDKPCPPGCDCPTDSDGLVNGGVLQAMDDHAEAVRVRESATAKEVIKEADNVMGMTCYDKALEVTSKLGGIFSDKMPSVMVPANQEVFKIPLPFPTPTAQKFFAENLGTGVSDLMKNYAAQNFKGSKSFELGAGNLDFTGTGSDVLGTLMDIYNSFFTAMSWIDGAQAWYNTEITTRYNNIVKWANFGANMIAAISSVTGWSFGADVASAISKVLDIIDNVKGEIDDISDLVNQYQQTAMNFLNDPRNIPGLGNMSITQAINTVFSLITMISDVINGEDPCSRMAQLWSKGRSDLPGFKPTVGGGVSGVGNSVGETGIPYLTVAEMLADEVTANPPQNILDFVQGITNDNGGQGSVLQRAVQQFSPGGVLSGPGEVPSWTKVPTTIFNPGATITDIRNAM